MAVQLQENINRVVIFQESATVVDRFVGSEKKDLLLLAYMSHVRLA